MTGLKAPSPLLSVLKLSPFRRAAVSGWAVAGAGLAGLLCSGEGTEGAVIARQAVAGLAGDTGPRTNPGAAQPGNPIPTAPGAEIAIFQTRAEHFTC